MPSFTTGICRNRRTAFWALAVCVIVPSLDVVLRHTGIAGVFAYTVAVPVALAALRRWVLPALRSRLSERAAAWLAAVTLLVLIGGFVAILFPLANSGRFGPGSDTNEAYDTAVRALLAGRDVAVTHR